MTRILGLRIELEGGQISNAFCKLCHRERSWCCAASVALTKSRISPPASHSRVGILRLRLRFAHARKVQSSLRMTGVLGLAIWTGSEVTELRGFSAQNKTPQTQFESWASVDQPSPKCCSKANLNSPPPPVNGSAVLCMAQKWGIQIANADPSNTNHLQALLHETPQHRLRQS